MVIYYIGRQTGCTRKIADVCIESIQVSVSETYNKKHLSPTRYGFFRIRIHIYRNIYIYIHEKYNYDKNINRNKTEEEEEEEDEQRNENNEIIICVAKK